MWSRYFSWSQFGGSDKLTNHQWANNYRPLYLMCDFSNVVGIVTDTLPLIHFQEQSAELRHTLWRVGELIRIHALAWITQHLRCSRHVILSHILWHGRAIRESNQHHLLFTKLRNSKRRNWDDYFFKIWRVILLPMFNVVSHRFLRWHQPIYKGPSFREQCFCSLQMTRDCPACTSLKNQNGCLSMKSMKMLGLLLFRIASSLTLFAWIQTRTLLAMPCFFKEPCVR